MNKLCCEYAQCGEPILMEQNPAGFEVYFCTLNRRHEGPCRDEKGRWFKPAERVYPRKKKAGK